MTRPTTALVDRSLWFGVGAFKTMTSYRTAQECLNKAQAARGEARTSRYPLRCLAQAAWWAAAADRCPQPAVPTAF